MKIPNLLLIAGTGTKSGKTSMACAIIKKFGNIKITAIKITPHFHETTDGLMPLSENEGYMIYEETNRSTSKDTSRMLDSGAEKVFFAKVWDDQLFVVFKEIMKFIPSGAPVICESPALRNFIDPGVFVIMTSSTVNKKKDISDFRKLPHVMLDLEDLKNISSLPFAFEGGQWVYELEVPRVPKVPKVPKV